MDPISEEYTTLAERILEAAEQFRTDDIDECLDKEPDLYIYVLHQLAASNSSQLFQYCKNKGIINRDYLFRAAADAGNLDMMRYAKNCGTNTIKHILKDAILDDDVNKQLRCLLLLEEGCPVLQDIPAALPDMAYRFLTASSDQYELDSALVKVVIYNNLEVLQALINLGASNYDGALENAAIFDRQEIVEYLFKRGVSEDTTRSVIMSAARNGNLDMLKLGMSNSNGRYQYTNDIYNCAAENGQNDIMEYIYPTDKNILGCTLCEALDRAIRNNHWGTVEWIRAYYKWNYPFMAPYAADIGNLTIVKMCYHDAAKEYGVPFSKDILEKVMYPAITSGHGDIVEFAIKNGVEFTNCDGFRIAAERGDLSMLRSFYQKIPSIEKSTLNNAMVRAAHNGEYTIFKQLVQWGADAFDSAMPVAIVRHNRLIEKYCAKHVTDKAVLKLCDGLRNRWK